MATASNRCLVVPLVILTILVGLSVPEGLKCYQCYDDGDKTDCQDAARLLNDTRNEEKKGDGKKEGEDASNWRRNKYYKDCDNDFVNNTMCMIETHSVGGVLRSYHRDCTDGKTFSFSGSQLKLPRLANLVPNNETTCSYYATSNMHVCLRLCNSDMCNGPIFRDEPDPVCYNITDDNGVNTTVCGASSPTHFLTHGPLNAFLGGLFGYGFLLPFLIYFAAILILV